MVLLPEQYSKPNSTGQFEPAIALFNLDSRVEDDLCFPDRVLGSCTMLRVFLLARGLLEAAGTEAIQASAVSAFAE